MVNNSKYSDYTFVWAFVNKQKYDFLSKNKNTVLVKLYSKEYYKYCAKAKFIITNTSIPNWISFKKDQLYINTWHGKPIKKIGSNVNLDIDKSKDLKKIHKGFRKSGQKFIYIFSPAPFFTEKMATAYGLEKNSKKVIEVGYPRNDFLFTYTDADVKRIKKELKIPFGKKVILYVPTWRNYEHNKKYGYVYQEALNFEKLSKELGKDYVILFKAHNMEEKNIDASKFKDLIYDVSHVEDINELYIISDLMISDYSGAIFDYANLKRPMLYYMWDKKKYIEESRGVDFDFGELPGPIITKEKELSHAIKEHIKNFKYDSKYKKFNEKYNCLDGKDCGKKFVDNYIYHK